MSVISIYVRVLGLLRPQARLVFILAAANIALAIAAFAEPLLFGRIIDRMTRAQAPGETAICCRSSPPGRPSASSPSAARFSSG
jgi:hypothetical protein